MEIIPAIDLRDGKCVRLRQGDYKQETIFSKDPVIVARRWVAEGATRLHLVDLDGASRGKTSQSRGDSLDRQGGGSSLPGGRRHTRRRRNSPPLGVGRRRAGDRRHSGTQAAQMVSRDGRAIPGTDGSRNQRAGLDGRHRGLARRFQNSGARIGEILRGPRNRRAHLHEHRQ